MNVKFALATLAAMSLCAAATAQNDETAKPAKEIKPLTIGDPARPIDISHWVKGEKVTSFESGKVYVLEFWATWCGPCLASMPHISSLQKEYKDYGVTVIGVSDEDLKTVTSFLEKKDKEGKTWDSKIGYTLTTDPDASVKTDYFKAAGQNGIPCAFIIGKDQHIEWIGHPVAIDQALDAVVKDSWDRAAFKTKWEQEQAAQREAMKDSMALRAAMKEKDWDKVLELLDAQIVKSKNAASPKMQKFMIMLVEMNKPTEAYAFGEQLLKDAWEDSQMLNQLAWTVVDDPQIKVRNLEFAMKAANRANELTKNKNGAILDTLARVYYEKGDLKNAVTIQKQAVDNAGDDGEMAESLRETLEKYQAEMSKKH